eukprot:COSAG03_NODE_18146_length_361_cov_0.736641_1_plen_46_part_01
MGVAASQLRSLDEMGVLIAPWRLVTRARLRTRWACVGRTEVGGAQG